MSGPKEEIENYINRELPANFTSDDIMNMYEDLEKDIILLKKAPGMNDSKMGMICQQKHKKFAFSYPVLFFKVLKGELNQDTLKKILKIKSQMDEKEISLNKARNRIIDGAKEEIKQNPIETRKKKVHSDGSVVQEMEIKCKVEDDVEDEDQEPESQPKEPSMEPAEEKLNS